MSMPIIVIAHNIRSTHNVGSIFRTCEGFGVEQLILSGYTPYPTHPGDPRLPHLAIKLSAQIEKTALGASRIVPFEHIDNVHAQLQQLQRDGWRIVALEQADHSINLADYRPSTRTCLLLGEEVHGIEPDLLAMADDVVEIPMRGQKESFNVSVATGIALYDLTTKLL